MNRLEEGMSSIENQSSHRIRECMSNVKHKILEELKGDINDMADVCSKEMEERKRRENNLVLFNLSERREASGIDNKRKDEEDVRSLYASLGLKNVNVLTTFRLGKKFPSKTRPLKKMLELNSHKKYLMDNAKFVSTKAPQHMRRVIISRDLTNKQRQERREMLQAWRNHQDEVGENVQPVIENGTIIGSSVVPDLMEVNEPPLSKSHTYGTSESHKCTGRYDWK